MGWYLCPCWLELFEIGFASSKGEFCELTILATSAFAGTDF
jgi:hypothetical protein